MTEIDTDLDTYLANHQKRMTEALKTANENIHKKASERQRNYEQRIDDNSIEIGSNILLKKHVQGRNKMQDNWHPTPYRVVPVLKTMCMGFKSGEDEQDVTTASVDDDNSRRRSKRTNAGKHSNPFNLPKSVLLKETSVHGNIEPVKFEQLGEAIAALGTSLGQSLGQTLQEGWLKHNMSNN
ncbi:unnamed protein product [Mytilus edulis]|uniref:Uncharacterized protein n=1 Tax=Mytilus edulis TaxID=6550 RepID=A0A8S3S5T0_MYTED|nr:unnamed protein product [Mytilus edulis]